MDYMDLAVRRKAVTFDHSLTDVSEIDFRISEIDFRISENNFWYSHMW